MIIHVIEKKRNIWFFFTKAYQKIIYSIEIIYNKLKKEDYKDIKSKNNSSEKEQ